MNDEFYIGWRDRASPITSRLVFWCAVVLAIVSVIAGATIGVSQRLIGRSIFEWGNVKEYSGLLKASPVPHLVSGSGDSHRFYYLVRPWKFGFDRGLAAQFEGKQVTVRGTLIQRDNQAMIEVQAGSAIRAVSGRTEPAGAEPEGSLGEQTLIGEIVDSKCFLGVMNPGQLKPHRACAVRCISGGVPPVLLVRQSDGTAKYFVLVSRSGKPVNHEVLGFVAEPVRIRGEVIQNGDMLVLRSDPASIERLP